MLSFIQKLLTSISLLSMVLSCSQPAQQPVGTANAHKDLQDVVSSKGYIYIQKSESKICVHFLTQLTCEVQIENKTTGKIENKPTARCWIDQRGRNGTDFLVYHNKDLVASITTAIPYKRDRAEIEGINGDVWEVRGDGCTNNKAPKKVQ